MATSRSIPPDNSSVHIPASRAGRAGVIQARSIPSNDLGPRDMLCGRGRDTSTHSGNRDFRKECASMKQIYDSMPRNEMKRAIVEQIYYKFVSQRYRFVRKDQERGHFYQIDVDDDEERAKLFEKIRQRIMNSKKGNSGNRKVSRLSGAREIPFPEFQVPVTSAAAPTQDTFLPEPPYKLVEFRIQQILKSDIPHTMALEMAIELGIQDGSSSLDSSNPGRTFDRPEIPLEVDGVGEDKSVSPRSTMCKSFEFESVDLQMTNHQVDAKCSRDELESDRLYLPH